MNINQMQDINKQKKISTKPANNNTSKTKNTRQNTPDAQQHSNQICQNS